MNGIKHMNTIFDFDGKKNAFVNILFSLLFLSLLFLTIAGRNSFVTPVTNGTGIDPAVAPESYTFTPALDEETDILTQRFTPSYTGLQFLSIRLATEAPTQIDCSLLFTITDNAGNTYLSTTVPSTVIANWRYLDLVPHTPLVRGNTYQLNIQCTELNGADAYRVFFGRTTLDENRQLTFNGAPLEGELDLLYVYHALLGWDRALLMFACVLSIFLSWIRPSFFRKKPLSAILIPGSALYLFAMCEALSYNTAAAVNRNSAIVNIAVILTLLLLLMAVTGSGSLAGVLTICLVLVFAVINHFTLKYRGTILLPADIYSAATAMDVANTFSLSPDREMLIHLPLCALLALLFCKTNQSFRPRRRVGCLILCALLFSGLFFVSTDDKTSTKLDIHINQWNPTERSKDIGSLNNFIGHLRYMRVQKPDNYSEQAAMEILQYHSTNSRLESNTEVTPNIIVIMSEAFADFSRLGEYGLNKEVCPSFSAICQEPNTRSGYLVVPVYGGGTSCTEFEFLTGCSMRFLGAGIAPYQQYIHTETTSFLSEPAFTDPCDFYAFHTATSLNWGRNSSYPLLGFDEFISTEHELLSNAELYRYWPRDAVLFDAISEIYDESDTLIAFAVTMQGHGGYAMEDFEPTIYTTDLSQSYPDVNQYLTTIHDMDASFGEFIDSLHQSDEPTVVVMFGDHLPSVNKAFYQELLDRSPELSEADKKLRYYETPYLVWANYDIGAKPMPELLSSNFLYPHLMHVLGLPMSDYAKSLYEISLAYPVISSSGIVDQHGNIHETAPDDVLIDQYTILQYYRLMGH